MLCLQSDLVTAYSASRQLLYRSVDSGSKATTMRSSIGFAFAFILSALVFGETALSTAMKENEHSLPGEIDVRVINGLNARPHEFPWQVSIRKRHSARHVCGGTLISQYLVLTAAHCIMINPCHTKYDVVLGAHIRRGKTRFQQHIKVKRWYVHSSYSFKHFKKDIALLWLQRPVQMSRAVHAIQIPPQGSRVPVGTKCFMSGWGRTSTNGKYSSILQKTLLSIAPYKSCARRNNRLFEVDYQHMVCAGGLRGRTGGCRGDSGGPLACWEKRRWILRGLVSWGHKNCHTGYYTVFTRVSSFVNWIKYTARKG